MAVYRRRSISPEKEREIARLKADNENALSLIDFLAMMTNVDIPMAEDEEEEEGGEPEDEQELPESEEVL